MEKNNFFSHEELLQQEADLPALQQAHRLLKTDPLAGTQRLEILARSGSVLSMMYLAEFYRTRSPIDLDKAKSWYQRAFDNRALNAIYNLGTLCFHRQELDEALQVFNSGIEQGDGPSLYWLAKLYISHPELGGSPEEIKKLLEGAINKGQVRAKNHLAFLYMQGVYGWSKVPAGICYYLSSLVEGFRLGLNNPKDRRLW
jgi:tetratricopeptide (TPR) repeat protein